MAQRQWHGGMHGGPGTEARTEALPPPPREAAAAGGAPHNPREHTQPPLARRGGKTQTTESQTRRKKTYTVREPTFAQILNLSECTVIHLIFSQVVSKVGTDELARWLYAHTGTGDTRVSKLLRTKAVDEAKRGAPAWPKTLHGAWERLNYTRYHRSRVVALVAYCPNQLYSNGLLQCARRPPAAHTGPCPSCSTPTHGSFAGKPVPHSVDYFINAQQGYKDIC